MRVSNLCWGLCATLAVASAAQADEPFDRLDDSPRFMLYVHKELGTARHKSTGPSFGFAVDRASKARIFDLRVAPFDGGAVMFNGLKLTGGTPLGRGYSGSYGEDESWSWSNPWLWAGAGLAAALGISCATDNWPCDGGSYNDDTYRVPGE